MLMDEGITYYCLNWNLKTTYLMYPFTIPFIDDTKILYIVHLKYSNFIMKSLFWILLQKFFKFKGKYYGNNNSLLLY
jgi:hypothetical protein